MTAALALIIALALFVGMAIGAGLLFWWILNWPVGPRF